MVVVAADVAGDATTEVDAYKLVLAVPVTSFFVAAEVLLLVGVLFAARPGRFLGTQ